MLYFTSMYFPVEYTSNIPYPNIPLRMQLNVKCYCEGWRYYLVSPIFQKSPQKWYCFNLYRKPYQNEPNFNNSFDKISLFKHGIYSRANIIITFMIIVTVCTITWLTDWFIDWLSKVIHHISSHHRPCYGYRMTVCGSSSRSPR